MTLIAEGQMNHDFEVLASTCDDGDCPELVRHAPTGMIGTVGRVTTATGEQREHIAWMTPAEWDLIVSRYRAR
jgi:hypothetical protein